jgi:branched-chain amino acid transport system ATP-binding protein
MRVLDVKSLTKRFAGLVAVDDVSFHVDEREIVGVIGPNGAGKSTLFNMIGGFLRPTAGDVDLLGDRITGMAANELAMRGLIKTFQLVRPFGSMDLRENLMVPLLLRGASHRDAEREADALLERFGLGDIADVLPGELPYAMRRRLEIARAFAAKPRLLLLDEALAGLTASELAGLMDILRDIRRDGVTLLLIEHVMAATMALCDRVIVLDFGRLIASGTPSEVTSHQGVIDAYLGQAH